MLIKEVNWPEKEEQIVVQCPQCNSEGEIEDVDRKKQINTLKKVQ